MVDLIIYAYLIYLGSRIVTILKTDSLIALSLDDYNIIHLVALLMLIGIDIIIDLNQEDIYKRAKKLKHDFIRLFIIFLIGTGMIVAYNHASKSHDPYLIDSNIDKTDRLILEDYSPISEYAGAIENTIYQNYGIRVYTGINPSDYLNLADYKIVPSTDAKRSEQYLINLNIALSLYSKEAIELMPKRMFIISEIPGTTIAGVNFNRSSHKENFIILCDKFKRQELTIHHEIFHTLNVYTDSTILTSFDSNQENCSLTSDYACTNSIEFAAEAWAHSIVNHKYTEHSKILNKAYAKFLKGFSGGMEADNRDYIDIINSLEDNNNLSYVSFFNEKEFNAKANLTYKDDPYSFLTTIPSYATFEAKGLIYNNKRIIDEEKYNLFISSIQDMIKGFDSYSGIEKIQKIYEHIKSANSIAELNIESGDYIFEKLHLILKSGYIMSESLELPIYQSFCLYTALYELGYDVKCIPIEYNDFYNLCVMQNLDKYSYIYDYSLEVPECDALLGFMIAPDDYKYFYDNASFLDYCSYENDRQHGVYNNILLLDTYDKSLIDNYAINMFRKNRNEGLLVIVSKEEVIDEVFDYLVRQEDINGHANIQKLYQNHINGGIYPGYHAKLHERIVTINYYTNMT